VNEVLPPDFATSSTSREHRLPRFVRVNRPPKRPPQPCVPCTRRARPRQNLAMRLGIAHLFGWAVAVTATADHPVADRRRIELIEPGTPAAPIHTDGKSLDDDAVAEMVAEVRASSMRATSASLDDLAKSVP